MYIHYDGIIYVVKFMVAPSGSQFIGFGRIGRTKNSSLMDVKHESFYFHPDIGYGLNRTGNNGIPKRSVPK